MFWFRRSINLYKMGFCNGVLILLWGSFKDIHYSGCSGAAGWSDDIIVLYAIGTDVSQRKLSRTWANNKVACRSHNCYLKAVALENMSERHSEIVQKHRGQRCSIFWAMELTWNRIFRTIDAPLLNLTDVHCRFWRPTKKGIAWSCFDYSCRFNW